MHGRTRKLIPMILLRSLSPLLAILIAGCTGVPQNVHPVDNFNLERYLGTWYEIARLDHSFERGLSHVTAQYSLRDDGGINVLNRGYFAENKRWKEAEGKAYFVDSPELGYLKVSFFGPFYGSYVIFELEREHYQYSVVSGPDKAYLWILAREPILAPELQAALIARASALGFDTEQLIFVDHSPLPQPSQ